MEKEWLVTLATLEPEDVLYTDYVECARQLLPTLQVWCDLYIHCTLYNVQCMCVLSAAFRARMYRCYTQDSSVSTPHTLSLYTCIYMYIHVLL